MDYFIGLDVGTGSIKSVLIDAHLNIKAKYEYPLKIYFPQPGWAEQDPDEWWLAVCESVRNLVKLAKVNKRNIKALSIGAQFLGVLPVDRNGNPLMKCIIWMDNRAEEEADKIIEEFSVEELLDHVGGLPSGKDALPKILWLKDKRPEIYNKTHKILDVKDYLIFKMTGNYITDYGCASARGTFDMNNKKYSEKISSTLDIPINLFPEMKGSLEIVGTLTDDASEDLELEKDTVVINGTGDIMATSVGTGAVDIGDIHLYIGTSAWITVIHDERMMDADHGMGTIMFLDPNTWIFVAEMENAGNNYKWMADNIYSKFVGKEKTPYELMEEALKNTVPGSNKLIFLPWMYGERAPIPDIYLRGAFINLSIKHTLEDMVRAVVEGIGYNLRWIREVIEEDFNREYKIIPAAGGFFRSQTVTQIIADVIGRGILPVKHKLEAVAKGAAIIAMVGYGEYNNLKEATKYILYDKISDPNPSNAETYEYLYEIFKELYEKLSDIFGELNSEY